MRTEAVVQQTVQGAEEETGVEFRAQIIEDEQVCPGCRLQQGLFLPGGVRAEVQRFQFGKKIGAGNIDHVHVLRQHDARNGKGRMGLAKARIAEQHQTFAAAVKFFCVGTQFFQKFPHVRPDRLSQLLIHCVGVVAQLHRVEAGNGQAGQLLDLLAAEFLHQFVDALAGVPLK